MLDNEMHKRTKDMITIAQIEKMVEARNASMKAENDARGAYFAATMRRAESIGSGSAGAEDQMG
jgi:hypothetical protein